MNIKISITVLHDFIIFCLSFFFALLLRLDYSLSLKLMNDLWYFCIVYSTVNISTLYYFGLYHGIWKYASINEIISIFKSITVSTLLIISLFFLIFRLESIPRSFPVLLFIVSLLGVTAPRVLYRIFKDKFSKIANQRVPIIVVGDGDSSENFIRLSLSEKNSPYNVVAIIGKKSGSIGRRIHNVPIISSIDLIDTLNSALSKFVNKKSYPQRIIIADQKISDSYIEKLYIYSKRYGMAIGIIPKMSNVSSNPKNSFFTNPIAIEDVLGRKQKVHNPDILKNLKGKKVLVTGAGGSIGSEICQQIVSLNPKQLILVEENEFNLYKISQKLKEKITAILADIRDSKKIENIFKKEKPDIIFHTAALKHITFVEDDPIEALKTNFLATVKLCEISKKYKIPKFIFISTDKAVYPSNIMGASKRLCEKYIQNISKSSKFTKFSIVRFGNVLGSTGSVVPLFQDQIKNGGPITITHSKVTRYFMTIREAVELVLISSQLESKKNGVIYILEMGEPVNIKELAKRMILLSGKNIKDIKIEFTGLRKGEKLFEQLYFNEEDISKTQINGIVHTTKETFATNPNEYDKLIKTIKDENINKSLTILKKMLPEYRIDVKD